MAEWKYPLLSSFPQLFHGTYSEAPKKPPIGVQQLLNPVQVHGSRLHIIEDPDAPLPPCDALATALPGIALMIRHADCQAALLYDPELQIVAAIHAGWRGLVQDIYPLTIAQLHDHYGCRPQALRIAISPSLGPKNAEFIHYKDELPESFWPHQVKPHYFDLKAIAKEQLLKAGILAENLYVSEVDTYTPESGCPSYRRTKTCDRMGSVIGLHIDQGLLTRKI